MAFNALQEAIAIVGEAELYAFDFGGAVGIEHYTTSRKPIVWTPAGWPVANVRWEPLPIARGSSDVNMQPNAAKHSLIMPCRPTFVKQLADGGLDYLGLTIIRGFGSNYDQDYINPWFSGYLSDISVTPKHVSGTIYSIESVFDTQVPRIIYQAECNNTLFDSVCGAQFRYNYGVVVGISDGGRNILVSFATGQSDLNGSAPAANYYTLGNAWKRKETAAGLPDPTDPKSYREILYSSNDLGGSTMQIVTHAPIIGLAVGDKLNFSPGCNHSVEHCVLKFGRRQGFVGTPLIPNINPIVEGF